MKYTRLVYGNNKKQLSVAQYVNLGDYFQTFAIDNIYQEMGIQQQSIVTLNRTHLHEYKGENIVLPMQGWFGRIKGIDIFPLPNDITPVFLGYHCITKNNYSKECINTYLKYAPVGCRDESTYLLMKKNNIPAYLIGCLTLTLPERTVSPEKTHVFLVDAPQGIESYMPDELKSNITYITQEIPYNSDNPEEFEIDRIEEIARKLLERYKNEATLVVTSRLHCASPCLAMGIPVILARSYFDDRYSWIDKFIPLYTPDTFSSIDWHPSAVDLSGIKPKLIKMASTALRCDEYDGMEDLMQEVHEFYMDRDRGKISVPIKTKMYYFMQERAPKFADFMREVVLKKFTVATARDSSEI